MLEGSNAAQPTGTTSNAAAKTKYMDNSKLINILNGDGIV